MDQPALLLIAADLVLFAHVLVVLFIVGGLLLTIAGGLSGWRWVRNPWFRVAHLAAIIVVAAQSWFGMVCPLTHLEMALRGAAGGAVYSGDFIGHWLAALLYYRAPPWVFASAYSMFGLLVIATWWTIRPAPFRAKRESPDPAGKIDHRQIVAAARAGVSKLESTR
jgi:hypothetical protein